MQSVPDGTLKESAVIKVLSPNLQSVVSRALLFTDPDQPEPPKDYTLQLATDVVHLTLEELDELERAFRVASMEFEAIARASGMAAYAQGITKETLTADILMEQYPHELERELTAAMMILNVRRPSVIDTLFPRLKGDTT